MHNFLSPSLFCLKQGWVLRSACLSDIKGTSKLYQDIHYSYQRSSHSSGESTSAAKMAEATSSWKWVGPRASSRPAAIQMKTGVQDLLEAETLPKAVAAASAATPSATKSTTTLLFRKAAREKVKLGTTMTMWKTWDYAQKNEIRRNIERERESEMRIGLCWHELETQRTRTLVLPKRKAQWIPF